MKYALVLLILFGCTKEYGHYSGGSVGSGSASSPLPAQYLINVRFYSSDSLMAKNCMLLVNDGADIPIRYAEKAPLCTDSLFEYVRVSAEAEYVFKVMNYDSSQVIDTFHFSRPKNSPNCVVWNLKRKW
ncbi:hypothetical protein [Paraflavitalea sp. CAU 1676]|uniref:hypothetical protein n=1 Tax=Paraflavitalea sp. CAU 1676 TaxID=3032598 RepID=UPI0023DAC55D|nr:hypothetical protein [Paraflavitalea sp. CAU 1676]MDF2188289.1 hypothetical protein [Paraflavitalea sp. CAU 1676]